MIKDNKYVRKKKTYHGYNLQFYYHETKTKIVPQEKHTHKHLSYPHLNDVIRARNIERCL